MKRYYRLPFIAMLLFFCIFWTISCEDDPNHPSPHPGNSHDVTLLEGSPLETDLYINEGVKDGPTVMIVGGVHGNETAGYVAADGIANWEINKGTLLVIPRANQKAIAASSRNAPGGKDLNRAYPGDPEGSNEERLAAAIFGVMTEYEPEWLLDLHEARDFHLANPRRLGQTLITYPTFEGYEMAELVVDKINGYISNPLHKFTIMPGPRTGSTAYAAGTYLGINSYTTETTRSLPLEERVFQQLLLVDIILSQLEMKELSGINSLRDEAGTLILNSGL